MEQDDEIRIHENGASHAGDDEAPGSPRMRSSTSAVAYYFKKQYDESWKDIKKAEGLGYKIDPKFLENLRNASGRQD